MTEEDLIEKIKLYSFFMKEGNKCPEDTDDYKNMISEVETDLISLKNN